MAKQNQEKTNQYKLLVPTDPRFRLWRPVYPNLGGRDPDNVGPMQFQDLKSVGEYYFDFIAKKYDERKALCYRDLPVEIDQSKLSKRPYLLTERKDPTNESGPGYTIRRFNTQEELGEAIKKRLRCGVWPSFLKPKIIYDFRKTLELRVEDVTEKILAGKSPFF